MKQLIITKVIITIVLAALIVLALSSCRAMRETECSYVKRSYVGYK